MKELKVEGVEGWKARKAARPSKSARPIGKCVVAKAVTFLERTGSTEGSDPGDCRECYVLIEVLKTLKKFM